MFSHLAMPEPFLTFVNELARSTETPIELSALLTLATISTTVQTHYEVQVKEDYKEPLNIWILGILPPASRKSRVFSEVINPLREWERQEKSRLEPIVAAAQSEQKTREARLKELRIRAAKARTDVQFREIQADIERIEKSSLTVPIFPQIWTGDVTPEHLGSIMAVNGEAMSVLSDEGGLFDILGGLYSDGRANIDLFLQSHAGSSVRVDRGSRPSVFMERPVLTIALTVQPQVVKAICGNKTFRGRGLLGRFLYAMPSLNIGKRSLDVLPMPLTARLNYQNAIRGILHKASATGTALKIITLESAAYQKWLEHSKVIEGMMSEDIGYLTHITDWAGKLPGLVARLAALLHIMENVNKEPCGIPISFQTMSNAVKIGHCLVSHALAVFDFLEQDPTQGLAKNILDWVKGNKFTHFTQRECLRRFRGRKQNELEPAFKVLQEHGFLLEFELKPDGGTGRPSRAFQVNPHSYNN